MTLSTKLLTTKSHFSLLIIFSILLLCSKGYAKEINRYYENTTSFSFPKTIQNTNSIQLPPGFEFIGETNGDLNKDDLLDLVLIVADTRESVEFDAPVYLGIYFKNSNNTFELNVVSTTAILCMKCGGVMGNPFAGVDITPKGILQIHHYGGSVERWGYLDKYRYQNGAFYLIGHMYTESSPDSPKTKTTDTNLLNGDQEIIEDSNIASKKETVKKTRTKVKVKPLKTIDTYSPGNI